MRFILPRFSRQRIALLRVRAKERRRRHLRAVGAHPVPQVRRDPRLPKLQLVGFLHQGVPRDLFFRLLQGNARYRQPGLLCTPRNFAQSS